MNKKELLARCKELGIENVTEKSTNAELQALISEKEAAAAASNPDQDGEDSKEETPEESPAAEKDEAPSYTDDRGIEWSFKKSAPKTINIDGRPMTQAEILEAEDVISELVYGNSNFIIRKNQ